jgi:hypothetical protein
MTRRRQPPELDRKSVKALNDAMKRSLEEGDYPQLRAMIGNDDPVAAFSRSLAFMTEDGHFESGLDALLDGWAKRFRSK